ncbi:hypothetical protein ZWY2020_010743 [Hordeum vulgare]|nr:hypothetical protein ZWY2020_010743 [Hordeum vulgare]
MARCVCAEALLRRLPAAAASGRAGGAQIWAAWARLGPSQPLCPHPPFSLLPPLPAVPGGCRWVVHARGDPDGCCDAVPRRIPAAEAAGRRGGGAVQLNREQLFASAGPPPMIATPVSIRPCLSPADPRHMGVRYVGLGSPGAAIVPRGVSQWRQGEA